MKTYTVKEIAELLKTNPETVRRWIRDKRLLADKTSRKDGNVITEDSLQQFLQQAPKYIKRFSESIATITAVMAAASSIEKKFKVIFSNDSNEIKLINNYKIALSTRITQHFQKYIDELIVSIDEKKGQIRQIEDEILVLEEELKKYQHLIKHKDVLFNDSYNVNTIENEKKE